MMFLHNVTFLWELITELLHIMVSNRLLEAMSEKDHISFFEGLAQLKLRGSEEISD